MAKLKLNLEALEVESFEIVSAGPHPPGTVRANQDADDRAKDAADNARSAATCFGRSCQPSHCDSCDTCKDC